MMQVVLLERVDKLGRMGEVVTVRDGFARNFLLPRKKALRATAENIAQFERERAALETRNSERKTEAGGLATKLEGQAFVVIRQAGDSGQLYGSVSPRDIADTINATGYSLTRTDVQLDHPIKALGLHGVTIVLHPEVKVTVTINVARSPDEAAKQARGESVIGARTEEEEVELEAIFDSPEASHKAQETEGEEDEAAGS